MKIRSLLLITALALCASIADAATTCVPYTSGPLQAQLTITPPTTDQYNNPLPAGTVLTYNVWMGTASGAETLVSSGLSGTTQVITAGIAAGNSYYFQATATDSGGTGGKSAEVCKGPFPAAVPGTFTITIADGKMAIEFVPMDLWLNQEQTRLF